MKTFFKHLLVIAFIATLFTSCKKDESKHPEIETLSLNITPEGKVQFNGKVLSVGTYTIKDYGFIYGSTSDVDEYGGVKISMGSGPQIGVYQTESDVYLNNMGYNRIVYAKAYITNDKGTVYGESKSIPVPTSAATNLSPNKGSAGDLVTISGQFFSTDLGRIVVSFGGVKASVAESTPNKIVVIVPSGINLQNYYNNQVNVSVVINGIQLSEGYVFTILPKFTSFAPVQGPISSVISIYGLNIPTGYPSNRMRVFFGSREITNFNANNNNELRIAVPDDITTEKFKISIIVEGVTTILPEEFTVSLPKIISLSSYSGLPSSYITVTGTNFATGYLANTKIRFGGILVGIQNISTTSLSFNVPSNTLAGEHEVELLTGPFVTKAPQKFTVKAPSLTSFSPTSGGPTEVITLMGEFALNMSYTVSFGSVTTNASTTTPGVLRVNVPYGVPIGKTKISISTGGLTTTSTDDFTVLGPELTSISPKSGVAGTLVTINGVGFNSYIGSNTVKFGTVITQVLSSSTTKLTVSVPSGIPPSAMKISVTTNGQTVVSTDNFTITN